MFFPKSSECKHTWLLINWIALRWKSKTLKPKNTRLKPVTCVTLNVRIQARLIGKGYNPVTTKLCLGVVLKKVLDGTETFYHSIVLIIMFLCLDLSEFTSLRQNELSAVEKSVHLYLLSFSFVVPKSHLHYKTNKLKV